MLIAYGVAWLWFERVYASSDRALTGRALANLQFTAESIAANAGADLDQYYQLVEVQARDPH